MGEFAEKLAAEKLYYQRAYLGSLLPIYVKSGKLGTYYQTLTDFNFLMAKIQHPDFGVQALIDDFNFVDDSEALTQPEYNSEKVKALNLIQAVLWMSADILTLDKSQLAGQLLGRLLHFNIPAIQGMSEVAKQWKAAPWLRPLTSCLTPPGRGLLRTLNGHSSSVNAVAVTADGKRAISGSDDNTLKVWDLLSGNVIASFTGESSIACCAIAPDGVTIVAGDASGRVYFLRLEGLKSLPISTPAYPKEFQQLLREKTENFVGRKFVFSAISDFLASYSRGYFTIVGTPGCGKSSILAQYVAAHPGSIYYNAAVEGKNRAEDFLASVCTQLIDKYLAANGETSEIVKLKSQIQNLESHDGSWFLSLLLQQISDKLNVACETVRHRQKLIIVIDSVDAIARTSQPPSTNLFYLPRYLGDRTYFILARRPFLREKSGLLIETPSQTLDLRDYPAQNREDALNYIQQYLSTAPDLTQPEFCQQLATVSENNFMYLSQMLRAIGENSHPDANLGESSLFSELPPGLAAYYQNHWLRMRGDGLSAIELSVLNVLVQSTTGLSVSAISNIIDEDEYEIEKVLDNWIEFLNSQEIRGEICYSLYHASFRQWLGKQSILE